MRTCSCVFNVLKLLTDYVVALEQFRLQKVSLDIHPTIKMIQFDLALE